jgi:AraC-like DNA-binding protein
MTLILTQSDWNELCQQAPRPQLDNLVLDDFENLTGVPECIGHGYSRDIEVSPGVWLNFSDCEYNRDLRVKAPVHDHPIQITLFLSGSLYCDIHPTFSETRSYFSGSGISPAYVEKQRAGERLTSVNIELEPELLKSGFLLNQQCGSDALRQLFKGEDWKIAFYPTVTPAIRAIAQQMWNAPYRGALKQVYLQAKVMELLVIYLDLVSEDSSRTHSSSGLKPETIARLHYAKEILVTQLEHPPSLPELAHQVGVSDRTLQRGFRQLFGATVFGYLHHLRMEQAEQLLRSRNMRVSEVAHAVGYSHLGHFTEAFKRKFGMTPKQYQTGVNARNYT